MARMGTGRHGNSKRWGDPFGGCHAGPDGAGTRSRRVPIGNVPPTEFPQGPRASASAAPPFLNDAWPGYLATDRPVQHRPLGDPTKTRFHEYAPDPKAGRGLRAHRPDTTSWKTWGASRPCSAPGYYR